MSNENINQKYSQTEEAHDHKKKTVIIVAIIVVVAILSVLAFLFGYKIFNDAEKNDDYGQDVKITVTEDMSTSDIVGLLKEKGLIDNSLIFRVQIKVFTSNNYGIIPGDYVLNTSMSHKQMIETMSGAINTEKKEEEHLGIKDY